MLCDYKMLDEDKIQINLPGIAYDKANYVLLSKKGDCANKGFTRDLFRSLWISVKDKLPDSECGESKDVLTVNSMGVMRVMNFDGGCWCYPTMEPYASAFKITHWTPLPEPPKEV